MPRRIGKGLMAIQTELGEPGQGGVQCGRCRGKSHRGDNQLDLADGGLRHQRVLDSAGRLLLGAVALVRHVVQPEGVGHHGQHQHGRNRCLNHHFLDERKIGEHGVVPRRRAQQGGFWRNADSDELMN